MIWAVVLGISLIVVLIIAAGKIKVELVWEDLEGTITVQYLFLRKSFPLGKKGGSEESRQKEYQEEVSDEPEKKGFSFASIKTIPDFFPAVRKFLKLFARYGRITRIKIKGELGARDPYYTGISYGLAQSLGQTIKSLAPQFEFYMTPNFEEEVYRVDGHGQGEIRFFNLWVILFVTFIYLPKKKLWQLVRKS